MAPNATSGLHLAGDRGEAIILSLIPQRGIVCREINCVGRVVNMLLRFLCPALCFGPRSFSGGPFDYIVDYVLMSLSVLNINLLLLFLPALNSNQTVAKLLFPDTNGFAVNCGFLERNQNGKLWEQHLEAT